MQPAQATTPPAPDANDGDDDVRMYYIPANLYRSFGVYKDDEDEACLVVAIHKSAFSSAAAQSCGAAAFNSTGPRNEDPPIPQKQSEIQLSILEKAHTSDQWMRLLFYSTDMILAESMEVLEMGQWCLLDEGLGNFLESAPSPNLQHVQVHLTRPVCTLLQRALTCPRPHTCYRLLCSIGQHPPSLHRTSKSSEIRTRAHGP